MTIAQTPQELLARALAAPNEQIARDILSKAGVHPDTLEKTISTGTGLIAYDLQAPAKNLYPVATPIIKRLPRVGGGVGTATNWRQVNAIFGSGYDAMGWVPEGQRAGQMSYSTSNKAASYVTLGEEDAATFEAINAGRTFEDIQARMTMRLLQKMMLKEEQAVIGGNNSLALGTPATPTTSSTGTGSTLASATYSVIVVGLTHEGYRNSSVAGGVATTKNITGADGQTFTLHGGSSNKSAAASQAVVSPAPLLASVTPLLGAVAYAWYIGTAGAETLQAITTINSIAVKAPLSAGNQPATAVTADNSTNTLAFDGLLTTAFKAGSNAYVNSLPTGVAGAGTAFTSSGKGGVNEIDNMLLAMWNNYQVSPTVIYCNAQQLNDITTHSLSNASAPLLNYFQSPGAGEYHLTAGGTVDFYFNPFLLDGGIRIPIKIHPQLAPGTLLGWCEDLPLQYQSNEVPNVAEIKTRMDYYQLEWPITTRQRQVGVYSEETLAVYAPFAIGVIENIAPG